MINTIYIDTFHDETFTLNRFDEHESIPKFLSISTCVRFGLAPLIINYLLHTIDLHIFVGSTAVTQIMSKRSE